MLGGWMLATIVLLVAGWSAIVTRRFPDADDAMRLLQVRDWLGGQSWFDVAQHRLNGGDFPMHWSRLVDLPLAAAMLTLRPLLGGDLAERVTVVVVPLLTLLAVMTVVASIARRVGGTTTVVPAVLLIALSTPLLFQLQPLRIDHHGWQIVFALAAARGLLAAPTARAGALTGAALAILLTISLEGLPIAAAVGGVAAIGWMIQPERGAYLRALAGTLAASAVLLHAATRGPGFWSPACDAVSPIWLGVLAVAAVGVWLAALGERFGMGARLAALVVTGVAAGGLLMAVAPVCLAGPFATLPPLVYRIWYLSVLEGQPLWAQEPVWAVLSIGLPLAGIVGGVIGWRRSDGVARERWTILLALVIASTMVALLVSRAAATANAIAAPAAALWLATLLARSRAIARPLPRIAATLGAVLLAAPGTLAALALLAVTPTAVSTATPRPHFPSCATARDMAALRVLPATTIFAPIDVTPALLVETPHRAIAGGYHRAAPAIARAITGFTAPPDTARRVILASGAHYLAACPGMQELDLYQQIAPHGLWARLERGERFDWLEPVPIHGPALAWRVIRPLPDRHSAP